MIFLLTNIMFINLYLPKAISHSFSGHHFFSYFLVYKAKGSLLGPCAESQPFLQEGLMLRMKGTLAQDLSDQQSNAFKDAMSMRIAPWPFQRNEELYIKAT